MDKSSVSSFGTNLYIARSFLSLELESICEIRYQDTFLIKELGFDCSSPKLSDVPLTQIPFLANLNQFSIPLVQTKLDESIDVRYICLTMGP